MHCVHVQNCLKTNLINQKSLKSQFFRHASSHRKPVAASLDSVNSVFILLEDSGDNMVNVRGVQLTLYGAVSTWHCVVGTASWSRLVNPGDPSVPSMV